MTSTFITRLLSPRARERDRSAIVDPACPPRLHCRPNPLKKLSEYRQHAEECRALARLGRTAEQRDMLLAMAATWESLAQARETQLAKEGARIEGPRGD
jgi:hypothetical protein